MGQLRLILPSISSAMYLTIGFYHLMIWSKVKTEKKHLYYFLFCCVLCYGVFCSWGTKYFGIQNNPFIIALTISSSLFIPFSFMTLIGEVYQIKIYQKLKNYLAVPPGIVMSIALFIFLVYKKTNLIGFATILVILYSTFFLIFSPICILKLPSRDRKIPILLGITALGVLCIIGMLIFIITDIWIYELFQIGYLVIVFVFGNALAEEYKQNYLKLEQKVKDRTADLAESNKKLALANESKTNFFINLAHETKTPLTLISNYFDSYIKELPEENPELLVVQHNLNKLTSDMVNFLDSEKIERGEELYLHDKIFNFSDMLTNELLLFRKSAAKKKINIESNVEKDLTIKAHDIAVNRIIRNLLDNAVKYTAKHGEINVTLKVLNGKINFIITDTGMGIPQEQLNNIFKPYYQISGRKHNYQGSGMGLYITKRIIDDLHGELTIESDKGNGTTVKAVLPGYCVQATERVEDFDVSDKVSDISVFDLIEEKVAPELPTILIVEDERGIIALLQKELKSDYNIIFTTNGKEALKRLPEIVPDLIISDIMMDGMDDGFDFITAIPEEYQDIPFIFLTARTKFNDKLKGLTRGAIDYIYKPFSMDEIKTKIKSLLKHKEQTRISVMKKLQDFITTKQPIKRTLSDFCSDFKISKQEQNVLKLLYDQLQNKEIAYALNITEGTVKNKLYSIFKKVNVSNRVALFNKIKDLDFEN